MIAATLMVACSNSNENKDTVEKVAQDSASAVVSSENKTQTPKEVWQDTNGVCGFYVGQFNAKKYNEKKKPMYSNLINIAIDSVVEKKVYGHSVVAGNSRPFTGKIMNETASDLEIEAKEPGDDKYDGMFMFVYKKGKKELEGTWVANDGNLAVTERGYALKKKFFKYDPNQELGNEYYGEVYDSYDEGTNKSEAITTDANKYNASAVELKSSDIENMYKRDLEVLRNSIYARHGYSFKNRAMRWFFDHEISWYIPVSTDVSAQLTELEKKNIDLIKTYEKHAQNYYDSYGR